jgi:hypothetical protein
MSNFSDEWDKRVDKTVERLTVSMTLYHTASFIHFIHRPGPLPRIAPESFLIAEWQMIRP